LHNLATSADLRQLIGPLCVGKIMEKSIQEKETTLKLIDKHLDLLSKLYKECYLQKGRGALILYPFHVENISQLSCIDYNTDLENNYQNIGITH
jgi:hypothetical protein